MKKLLCTFIAISMLLTTLFPLTANAKDNYQNNDVQHAVIHDPSLMKANDGKYYIVGSHLAMGVSDDLVNWTDKGFSLDGNNYLTPASGTWKDTLAEPLSWCLRYQNAVPDKYYDDERGNTMEYNCWANNVIYNSNIGKYCLYGCCSVWGTTASAIWLCVSDNIDGPYTYVDTLLMSGVTSKKRNDSTDPVINALDWHNSNVVKYVNNDYLTDQQLDNNKWLGKVDWLDYEGRYDCGWGRFPNCIDPTVFTDKDGDFWLVYGSYSGGCYIHKLNKYTGLIDIDYAANHKKDGYDVYYGKQISKTNEGTEGTGEGPFIIYDKVSKYYYFFLTYGGLAGDGGYNIREYRSTTPEGPYLDAAGFNALDEKNTGLKLDGNYQFSCQPTALLSGGHSSCLIDDDGSMYQAYHTRFTADDGWGHQVRIHKMLRTEDGWSVMTPFEYQGEGETACVTADDVVGTYEFIDSNNMYQRKEKPESPWSDIVLPTQTISLNKNGKIIGAKKYSCTQTNANTGSKDVSGTWTLKNGTAYCTVKLGDVTYNCVFTLQKDESEEGKTVLTLSGAGNDNSTIWGVKASNDELPEPTPAPAPTPKPTPAPTVNVTVLPTKFTSLKGAKKSFIAKWNKVSGASGYQLQYSLKKNFKGAKTVNVKSTKKTIKKLKKKKKYYVRVRAYKTVAGKNYYSPWTTKTVKPK